MLTAANGIASRVVVCSRCDRQPPGSGERWDRRAGTWSVSVCFVGVSSVYKLRLVGDFTAILLLWKRADLKLDDGMATLDCFMTRMIALSISTTANDASTTQRYRQQEQRTLSRHSPSRQYHSAMEALFYNAHAGYLEGVVRWVTGGLSISSHWNSIECT